MKYQKHQKIASIVVSVLMILMILDMVFNDYNHWKLIILSLFSYSYIMFPNFWKYVLPMHYRRYSTEVPSPNPDLCFLVGWGGIFLSILVYALRHAMKIRL